MTGMVTIIFLRFSTIDMGLGRSYGFFVFFIKQTAILCPAAKAHTHTLAIIVQEQELKSHSNVQRIEKLSYKGKLPTCFYPPFWLKERNKANRQL